MRRVSFRQLSWLVFPALAAPSGAAEQFIPEKETIEKIQNGDPDEKGWAFKADIGATFNLTHTRHAVGNPDGTTLQINTLADASADWRGDQDEWLNALKYHYGLSKTPVLDAYIKSADDLEFKTLYLHRLGSIRWLGPFARFKLNAGLFEGYHVQATDVEVVRLRPDGSSVLLERLEAQNRFVLVDPFEPLVLRESAGFFANPLQEKWGNLNLKLGGGFQQVLVRDGYVLADDKGTPSLEVKPLEDSEDAGVEFEAEAGGEVREGIGYSLLANFFQPLTEPETGGLEGMERLNSDLSAKLSVKLVEWASLDYLLSAKRIPLVLDEWQVQNGLVLAITYSLL